MDATLTPPLHLQPLSAGRGSRLLRRGCAMALVVALHVVLLGLASRSSPPVPAQPTTRTIYASVLHEPTPAPAPAASAEPTPPPPVAPVVPAPAVAPPVARTKPVAPQPAAHPKPVAKPHAVQRPVAAVAAATPSTRSAPAAPAAAPAPAPPPQPKTLIRGVEYVQAPEPEYPDSAREEGHEGTVILRVLVDEHGKPGAVDIVRSSGFGNLDEAGRTAVRRALFKPYLEDGHGVSVYVIVPLRFQLDS